MGAWQGFWVTRVGVSSFIVTLAGMLYFRGLSMIVTNGATVAPLPRSLTELRHRLPAAGPVDRRHPRRPRRPTARCACSSCGARAQLGVIAKLRSALAARARAGGDRGGRGALDRLLAGHPLSRAAGRGLRHRRRVRHAPHPLRRAALRDRRQPGGGAARRHRHQARDLLELRHRRARLRHHRRRADRAGQRRGRPAAPGCSWSSTPSPRRSSAARRWPAAAAACSARCSARC